MPNNPLVSDRNVEFLLYEVFDVEALCHLNAYEEHSRETFDLFSTVVVSWQWILQAAVAKEKLAESPSHASSELHEDKICAAEYWIKTELPRVEQLAHLCRSGEGSYDRMNAAWF